MTEKSPIVPADVQAAHDAAVDARLAEILGGDDDPETEEEEPHEDEAVPEGGSEEEDDDDDPEGDSEDAAEEEAGEVETTPVTFSKADQLKAWAALERDGWTEEEIAALPVEALMHRGLKRATAQAKNDEVYADRDRLRSKLGMPSALESNEEKPGGTDPAQAGGTHPKTAGVDLTSLAGPVAEAIAEMNDPKEVAAHLASFARQAVQAELGNTNRMLEAFLADRAAQRIAGRYEGDIAELQLAAAQLGGTGRHSDKQGLARFDALLEDALKLSGKEVVSQAKTNTSPAPKKRGARPPMGGKSPAPKERTEEEILDAKLARILAGERDASKLRAIK